MYRKGNLTLPCVNEIRGRAVHSHIFHKQFKIVGPAVLPVIHAQDDEQIDRNIEIAVRCGAQGVFLINHDFDVEQFLLLVERCRQAHPLLWLGEQPLRNSEPSTQRITLHQGKLQRSGWMS